MRVRKLVGILCLCSMVLMARAQPGRVDYEARWKVVDSLLRVDGLPLSALAEVSRIDAIAKQEHRSGQEMRALIYRLTIQQQINSDADTAAIQSLEKDIPGTAQPERSLLESLLASSYLNYLQRNRYFIYGRTATVVQGADDMATWTIDDFHRRISNLFLASVKEERLLQGTAPGSWEPILITGNWQRRLQPTLYDHLVYEALDYFKGIEATIHQPVDAFDIEDTAVFADASIFTAHVFGGMDANSLIYQALLLYQRLIRFHLKDAKPDALIGADIERLGFARRYSVDPNKNAKYLGAMAGLSNQWGDLPAAAQAWYLQADRYHDQATAAGMARAKAICERVLREPDSSEGRTNCRRLLENIVRPAIDLVAEEFNVPERPFRCLVKWSNLNRVYFHLVKIDSLMWKKELEENTAGRPDWLQAPVYRSFSQGLPDSGDYLIHSVEIPIGSLPAGTYALLANTDNSWNGNHGIVVGERIYVTGIAYVFEGPDYFAVNRESGQPLNDVRIQVWEKDWNSGSRKWQLWKAAVYHTDQQGHFHLGKHKGYDQFCFEFSRPGEHLYMDQNGPFYYREPGPAMAIDDKEAYEDENTKVFFFLDRSIYRPGQTVYFKEITVTRDYDTRQLKPVAGCKRRVGLIDPNRENIDSIELTTDEFGSCHGEFHLPDHGLNGQFQVMDSANEESVSAFAVEEYKRPRFAVSFDRLKGSYRVGDSIRVKGNAIAYAGNSLDGATVKYRVTRSIWALNKYHYRQEVFSQSGVEIAHGVLKTDANGDFRIVFDALPDRSFPGNSELRYEYKLEADVTDINGETRSGSATIVAGYSVLDLAIELKEGETMPADSLRAIRTDVNNLSGEPVPATVHLAAYPLKAPNRLIRERLWSEIPDRWVMSEAAFLDSFPHDQYREGLKKENWPRGTASWEGVDSTGGHPLALQLKPGWWAIEATAIDTFGQRVKDTRYVELYDNQTGGPVNPEYLWAGTPETHVTGEPGGTVQIATGSSTTDVFIIRKVGRPNLDSLKFLYLTAASGRHTDFWPITAADRGGFGIADAFVKDNRLYVHQTIVDVPWDNKQLQIHYTSFRDKTEPGSKEKWAVSVSGLRGSGVAAQGLAAMYDASLDQFAYHSWNVPYLYPTMNGLDAWQTSDDFRTSRSQWLEPEGTNRGVSYELRGAVRGVATVAAPSANRSDVVVVGYGAARRQSRFVGLDDEEAKAEGAAAPQAPPVQVRTNFQETAFFFPDLRTDSMGNVSFSFTMPESLTQWKWMTLAHTRDLAFGYSEKTIITQKQLMVQPNVPRFLREGDKINLSVKVVNLTDSERTGQMGLSLTDPTNGEPADGMFLNRQPNQYFTVPARGSSVVEFPVEVPYQYNRPVSYRIVAEAGAFSDGEQAMLPVVSNRMLVTETLPLDMASDGTRTFRLEKLLKSGSSETLNHHALTVEFTANPAWYAVQALPYLMEFPYECAEQTFDRLYANALASKIVAGSPRIAQVFERWRTVDTAALLSNLEKNPELKSVLLEETPWVLEGKTETEQKRRIALLFDMTRIGRELESTIARLGELQASDGGFPWFKGGPDDRYVTQYILTGLGRLQRMEALSPVLEEKIRNMVVAALGYADREITKDYQQDLKVTSVVHWISPIVAQYLYMRSLFNDVGIPGGSFAAVNFFRKVAQQEWVRADKFIQGMVALALFRTGDVATARSILASLRETAIRNEQLGMYWKGMEGGYYWYQAPVETEAVMIETFREIGPDTAADRQLKTWLLRQKQTHNWTSTKATADAVYALLMGGSNWLDQQREVKVQLGDKVVEMSGEAGTGYDKKIFDAPFIDSSMGHIKVSMSSAKRGGSPAWGSVYWQYFDQLDQITTAEGARAPLRLEKRLYVQRNTDRGPVLDTIAENGTLHVGDRVVVRLVLRTDRDLEYVHLKDMRAACLEPLNVLSGYHWQGGLGYYESTKDVSTEFFFSSVPRGAYVFEYPLVVEQTGEFSNGVASVECLYAPEFAFHTEGIRVNVEGGQ
ncbi:MAG TPA: alpha-2-macroglobulin family protein [Puia sp.]|nr:alpha-2-macroglobulin family protein [Puia sp.]